MSFIFEKETYDIIGAAMEVHKHLSSGFTEPLYQDAFAYELELRNIPFSREKELKVKYKEKILDHFFRADFICYDKIIVELKAVSTLNDAHKVQLLGYLKATGHQLGLLLNFGSPSLEYTRVIC